MEPYRNLHGSACLHGRRIRNRSKLFMVQPVYMEDEFGTVPNYSWFSLFTRKTNSEQFQTFHGSACLHGRRIRNRSEICMVQPVYKISLLFRIRLVPCKRGVKLKGSSARKLRRRIFSFINCRSKSINQSMAELYLQEK